MRLTKEERETIVVFNEADPTASVYTHNLKLRRKLYRLSMKHPNLIYPERPEHPGAVSYIVPKRCISIREPYNEARRKADSDRAKEENRRPPGKGSIIM